MALAHRLRGGQRRDVPQHVRRSHLDLPGQPERFRLAGDRTHDPVLVRRGGRRGHAHGRVRLGPRAAAAACPELPRPGAGRRSGGARAGERRSGWLDRREEGSHPVRRGRRRFAGCDPGWRQHADRCPSAHPAGRAPRPRLVRPADHERAGAHRLGPGPDARDAGPTRPVPRARPREGRPPGPPGPVDPRRAGGGIALPAHLPPGRARPHALRRGLPRPDGHGVPSGLALRDLPQHLRVDPPAPREVRDRGRHRRLRGPRRRRHERPRGAGEGRRHRAAPREPGRDRGPGREPGVGRHRERARRLRPDHPQARRQVVGARGLGCRVRCVGPPGLRRDGRRRVARGGCHDRRPDGERRPVAPPAHAGRGGHARRCDHAPRPVRRRPAAGGVPARRPGGGGRNGGRNGRRLARRGGRHGHDVHG